MLGKLDYSKDDIFKYVSKEQLEKCANLVLRSRLTSEQYNDPIYMDNFNKMEETTRNEIKSTLGLELLGFGAYKMCFRLSEKLAIIIDYQLSDKKLYTIVYREALLLLLRKRKKDLLNYFCPILQSYKNWSVVPLCTVIETRDDDSKVRDLLNNINDKLLEVNVRLEDLALPNVMFLGGQPVITDYDDWSFIEEYRRKIKYVYAEEDNFLMSILCYLNDLNITYKSLDECEEIVKDILPSNIYENGEYNLKEAAEYCDKKMGW